MKLSPELILKLLTHCIKDVMQEGKQRLTKDMLDMGILEKVKRERRNSMPDALVSKSAGLSRK